MANNLRDFLSTISKTIGVEDLEFLNSIPDEVEAPENFTDLFHSNYLTMSSAKNNRELNDFYRGKNLGTVDSRLKALLKANGLEDSFKEFEDEKDTLVKLEKAFEVVKGQSKTNGTTEDKKQLKELQTKITELHSEIEQRKDFVSPDDFKKHNSEWQNKFLNFSINDRLSKKQLTEALGIDEVNILVSQGLKSLPYEFKMNDKDSFDVYEKGTEMIAHDKGKPLDFDTVIDTLSEKYVKKSTPQQQPNNTVVVDKPNQQNGHSMGSYVFGGNN